MPPGPQYKCIDTRFKLLSSVKGHKRRSAKCAIHIGSISDLHRKLRSGLVAGAMSALLQALSDKAKETRDQFARTAQGPNFATVSKVSKAELQTTRGPNVLTESVQMTARDPVPSVSGLQTELEAVGNQQSKDQVKIKHVTESPAQMTPSQPPLSDSIRLYLVAFAAACLLYNHAGRLLQFFRTTGIGLLDLVAVVCIVAAAPALPKTQMNETLQAIKLQATSAGVAVRALPQMSVEITAMLQEIRAMRHDLGNMAKKTAWLPGS